MSIKMFQNWLFQCILCICASTIKFDWTSDRAINNYVSEAVLWSDHVFNIVGKCVIKIACGRC